MHTHEHEHCFHNLKYCSICDEVFCGNCHKEWQRKWWNHLFNYYTAISPLGINLSPTGTTTVNMASSTTATHSHAESTGNAQEGSEGTSKE